MLKQTAKWCASLFLQRFYFRLRQQYRQLPNPYASTEVAGLVVPTYAPTAGHACFPAKRTDWVRHAAVTIPDTDSIIMFLAVGHLPDVPFRVAQSPRRPFADVMTVL